MPQLVSALREVVKIDESYADHEKVARRGMASHYHDDDICTGEMKRTRE